MNDECRSYCCFCKFDCPVVLGAICSYITAVQNHLKWPIPTLACRLRLQVEHWYTSACVDTGHTTIRQGQDASVHLLLGCLVLCCITEHDIVCSHARTGAASVCYESLLVFLLHHQLKSLLQLAYEIVIFDESDYSSLCLETQHKICMHSSCPLLCTSHERVGSH